MKPNPLHRLTGICCDLIPRLSLIIALAFGITCNQKLFSQTPAGTVCPQVFDNCPWTQNTLPTLMNVPTVDAFGIPNGTRYCPVTLYFCSRCCTSGGVIQVYFEGMTLTNPACPGNDLDPNFEVNPAFQNEITQRMMEHAFGVHVGQGDCIQSNTIPECPTTSLTVLFQRWNAECYRWVHIGPIQDLNEKGKGNTVQSGPSNSDDYELVPCINVASSCNLGYKVCYYWDDGKLRYNIEWAYGSETQAVCQIKNQKWQFTCFAICFW